MKFGIFSSSDMKQHIRNCKSSSKKKKKVSETPPCTVLEMSCVSWHLLQLCEIINACPEAVGLLQGTQRDNNKRSIIKTYYFGHFLI